MTKVLHIGDIHAKEDSLDELRKCFDTVLDTASGEHPDLVVHSGDTFDHQSIRLDTDAVRETVDFFRDLLMFAPVAVVIGTPTHDGQAARILEALDHMDSGRILVASMPQQAVLYRDRFYPIGAVAVPERDIEAVISFVPTPTKQYWQGNGGIQQTDAEIAQAMSALFAGMGAIADPLPGPHILVGHFSVRGAQISETQQMIGREIEIGKDQIELALPDLVCLGHIHKPQQIDNIFYSGSLYTLNWGEMHEHGFWIHECEDRSKWNHRFVKTPTKKLVKLAEDFTADSTSLADLDMVLYSLSPEEVEGAHIRVEFKVWQDEAARLDQAKVQDFFFSAGAKEVDYRIIRVPRETIRAESIMRVSTLPDKVKEMAKIRSEEINGGILDKAALLETEPHERIIEQLASNAPAA